LKEKKTALTSTWKNLPLEATKNSKKLKKEKTIQEKKKEKKSSKGQSFYYVNYEWSIIASKVSQIFLSNENINTDVSVVFKTNRELKCQTELLLNYHFSGNTILYVFIAEII